MKKCEVTYSYITNIKCEVTYSYVTNIKCEVTYSYVTSGASYVSAIINRRV